MKTHLEIRSAPYRLDVRLHPGPRGSRKVVTKVHVSLAWAVPFEIVMSLPEDGEDLREMLRSARGGYFVEWLTKHGYDEYGRGKGTWGALL